MKKPKNTKTKIHFHKPLHSVRMQIKGNVLGNPVDENKDTIHYTGPLLNDALFIECRDLAIREYNKVIYPLERQGQKFAKGGRTDALRIVMLDALSKLRAETKNSALWPSTKDLLDFIRRRVHALDKLKARVKKDFEEERERPHNNLKELMSFVCRRGDKIDIYWAIEEIDAHGTIAWWTVRGQVNETPLKKFRERYGLLKKNQK